MLEMKLEQLLYELNYPKAVERAVLNKILKDQKQILIIAKTAYTE